MKVNYTTLPLHFKFWIYALQGILYELCFTAIWDFCISQNPKLVGESSIWSIFVYGGGGLVCEYLIVNNIFKHNILFRTLVYLLYTYAWEYLTGFILLQFAACPWDYTERRWNLHGLITLEYAPAWIFAGILHERLVILLNNIYWCDSSPYAVNNMESKCD